MSSVSTALIRSRSKFNTAYEIATSLKASGGLGALNLSPSSGVNQLNAFRDQSANRARYGLFHGWVHSAVHALASEAAEQPVNLGRIGKSKKKRPGSRKSTINNLRMPSGIRTKASADELELLPNHQLHKVLEKPNPIQGRWQFTYNHVANICLTGWSFIVGGTNEEGHQEFYSIPTTWVRPDHSKGPFAQFRIVNPKNPTEDQSKEPLDRSQVAFAFIPNPADPMAALAPAQAQSPAIKIDDKIQSSQEMFFDNGIFPSVIITIGSNPHPDLPGGFRPRLTGEQRRQVYGAIKKVSGGIANYGNPAIIDGLIEKIEKLSMTQNEMGWEKSEKSTRTRILSAFGVHPFILGEEVAGSYAQSYNVERRFAKRVNTFLDMLSVMMTGFVNTVEESEDEEYLAWWEEVVPVDPSMEKSLWEGARKNDDITQNEFRSFMGLPADEDRNESVINKGVAQHVAAIAAQVTAGGITQDQAVAILEGMGLPTDLATRIAGPGKAEADVAEEIKKAVVALSRPLSVGINGVEDAVDVLLAEV